MSTVGNKQKINVRIEDENVWLTQKLIAELFDVDVRTVNEHLVNIYLERELDEKEASREVARDTNHYYGLSKTIDKLRMVAKLTHRR